MFKFRSSLLLRVVPSRWTMSSNYPHGASGSTMTSSHTVTALRRWSILDRPLPDVNQIKAIHVYDFDNTLFKTPLPNPKLWNSSTIGSLSTPDIFTNGGWWHDSRILAATGDGVEREEARAWEGWWNEQVVELVRLSMKQNDALCVMLTGRSERGFTDLLKRMTQSKKLDFHMIGLKPKVGPNHERIANTMQFKQLFLTSIMETYKQAKEIRIYDDRIRHVQGFRSFLGDYNRQLQTSGSQRTRDPIKAEVIEVVEQATTLDPVVEVAEIQHLLNSHNAALPKRSKTGRLVIKKTVFFTGYMIDLEDTKKLLALVQIPQNVREADIKYHGNGIMICPRLCPDAILEKVGGLGAKLKWEVVGTGCYENSVWAAQVRPVDPNARYHTENSSQPFVVLAMKKGARAADAAKIQRWQPLPPEQTFAFDSAVGEKLLLRIEDENVDGDFDNSGSRSNKRKNMHEEDSPRGNHGHGRGRGGGERGFHSGRGGADRGRGNFRGNNTPSRGFRTGARGGHSKGGGRSGKGGGHGYRSLDDVGGRDGQKGDGFSAAVSYDDSFPTLPPGGPAGFPPQPQFPHQAQHPPPQFQMPYQQPLPQGMAWQPQGGGPPPQGGRPMGGPAYGAGGPDLQNFY